MRSQRRKQAEQPADSKNSTSKKQKVASKKVGKVALACLLREATLLRCSLVHLGGSRQKAALWISTNQWKQILLRVVLPFFVGSAQLEKQSRYGTNNTDSVGESQLADSWLQYPELVKPTSESNRVKYLYSGCVRPAAWSKIDHKKAAGGLPGTSTRSNSTPLVRKWCSTDGYYYVEFKVLGVLALVEDEYDEKELASKARGLRRARAEALKARLKREGEWRTENENYTVRVSQRIEETSTKK